MPWSPPMTLRRFARLVVRDDIRANRERRSADPRDRHGVKTSAGEGHGGEVSQVLAYRDSRTEQLGVRGSREIGGVVDVERIDADECRPRTDEDVGAVGGEKWMVGEIRVGSPVPREVR